MSDYEQLQKKRNFTVGLFVLMAVSALVWLMYRFEDLPVKLGRISAYQVFIQFPAAPGVQEKTPVRFCGYQIGKVSAVRPPAVLKNLNNEKFIYQTTIAVSIDDKYDNIPADVEPRLMTRGFGSSYIEFKAGPIDVNAPQEKYLVNGSLLQGSTATTSEFFPEETQEKLEELVDKFKDFIENINDVIGDKEAKENLKAVLANLADATKQASLTLNEFKQLGEKGTDALANAEFQVQRIGDSMVDVSGELSKASAELQKLLEKINKGHGTAGKLVNDARLYEGLLENSRQLDVLLEQLQSFVSELPQKGIPIKLK